MKKCCTGFLIIALLFCNASLYSMRRTVSITEVPSDLLEKFNREEGPLSPKSTGMQLILSCRSGELKGALGVMVVKEYIKSKPDLTVCDEQGSALMWASFFGLSDIVTLLMKHGASCDVVSKLGYTPLHAAAQKGHLFIVKHFVEEDLVPVNVQAQCGSTPLHLAAQEGRIDIVYYLLAHGALTDVSDCLGRTALHIASLKGQVQVCRMLIKGNAQVDARAKDGLTPLHMAAFSGDREVVDVLLEAAADCAALTASGESVIAYAEKRNCLTLVLYLQRYLIDKAEVLPEPVLRNGVLTEQLPDVIYL